MQPKTLPLNGNLSNQFQRTRLITPSTNKHYSFKSELYSPKRSRYTNSYTSYLIYVIETSTSKGKQTKTELSEDRWHYMNCARSNSVQTVRINFSIDRNPRHVFIFHDLVWFIFITQSSLGNGDGSSKKKSATKNTPSLQFLTVISFEFKWNQLNRLKKNRFCVFLFRYPNTCLTKNFFQYLFSMNCLR